MDLLYIIFSIVVIILTIIVFYFLAISGAALWVNDFPRSRKLCISSKNLLGKTALITGK